MSDEAEQPETDATDKRGYKRHGHHTLKAAVRKLGARVIDRRTVVGRALEAWRSDLVADLGGRDAISTQQLALVDLAVRTKLMIDSVDTWILGRKSLVDGKRRALIAVVRERQSLAAHLQGLLKDLGLERRAAKVPDLESYLRGRVAAAVASQGAAGDTVSAEKAAS